MPVSEKSLSNHDELSILIKGCLAHSRSAQKNYMIFILLMLMVLLKSFVYNNEPVAKEILNDSFFKIFRDLKQYSFQGAFEGWIRRIVANTVADHLRKTINRDQPHKELQAEDAYINSESVENLSHKELLKIIETLPDAQKEVFNLFVFENYSHKKRFHKIIKYKSE